MRIEISEGYYGTPAKAEIVGVGVREATCRGPKID